MDIKSLPSQLLFLACDPRQTRWVLPLILLADALLTALVVWKVPYTEIDFTTYMAQVRAYLKGARDYTLIEGPTGPCVYPAGHVYAYSLLYKMTEEGTDIAKGQILFAGLYLLSLVIVGWVYWRCEAPPYLFPLLIFSKRLHSIFVLRLFNDCFAVLLLFMAILLYQRKMWNLGSVAFSLGVSVKMSLLLALPGILVVIGQAMSAVGVLSQVLIMVAIQIQLALPFIRANRDAYLSRAFEFSRQFLFKWTVNWRFLGEETFLSKEFSYMLLIAHATFLFVFALTRWTKASDLSIPNLVRHSLSGFTLAIERNIGARLTPKFITTTILSSVVIGMLFARSLHYQFYAYIAWATPLLLWRANFHPIFIYLVWAAQEWSWNVFPSTDISSKFVVATLAIQMAGIWWGTMNEFRPHKQAHAHLE